MRNATSVMKILKFGGRNDKENSSGGDDTPDRADPDR